MRTRACAAALAVALWTCAAAAARADVSRRLCSGFLPPNNLKIPIGTVHSDGVVEARFNRVLDRVQKVYGPIVRKHGGKLVIERKWTDETVNAYAEQTGKEWHIVMFGGLARHPAVTEEGFAVVACHELGHHLGGYPKIGGSGWATNEGGADYYATLKCLRQVLPIDKRFDVDPYVSRACADARGRKGSSDCEHAAMAGLSVSKLLAELGGGAELSFATPDPSVVEQMDDSHPAAQCRLDTYFQGSLCARPVKPEQSNTDPAKGACTAKGRDDVGLRPRCWYMPPANEPTGPGKIVAQPRSPDLESMRRAIEASAESLAGRGA